MNRRANDYFSPPCTKRLCRTDKGVDSLRANGKTHVPLRDQVRQHFVRLLTKPMNVRTLWQRRQVDLNRGPTITNCQSGAASATAAIKSASKRSSMTPKSRDVDDRSGNACARRPLPFARLALHRFRRRDTVHRDVRRTHAARSHCVLLCAPKNGPHRQHSGKQDVVVEPTAGFTTWATSQYQVRAFQQRRLLPNHLPVHP